MSHAFTERILDIGWLDCMSKQGDSPDYECGRQLWSAHRRGTADFHAMVMSPAGGDVRLRTKFRKPEKCGAKSCKA